MARIPGVVGPVGFISGPRLLAVLVLVAVSYTYFLAQLARFHVGDEIVGVTYPYLSLGRNFSFSYSEIDRVRVTKVYGNHYVIHLGLVGHRSVRFAGPSPAAEHFVNRLRVGIERSSAVRHPLADDAIV